MKKYLNEVNHNKERDVTAFRASVICIGNYLLCNAEFLMSRVIFSHHDMLRCFVDKASVR